MTQDNATPPSGEPISYATPGITSSRAYTGPPATQDDKNMGMLMYILAIVTGFLGPLIVWLIKKDTSPFLNDQGKELLNFQITTAIAWVICMLLVIVIIGFFLMPVVALCYIIFLIMGILKVKDGIPYRFPFAIRLLK